MEHVRKNAKLYALALLAVALFFVARELLFASARPLTVAFLDVGQGDAIFIEAPNGNQILIDGGPGKSVLRELGRMMPPHDRSIDVVVVTNPDKDHFAGFIDVLERFEVGAFIEPGTISRTEIYRELEKALAEEGIGKTIARRGMRIWLDDAVSLDVLFPDRDVSNWRTNDGSIVARLSYGETSVLLMGDSTKRTEGIIAGLDGASLESDILKVGHHGSRTSSGAAFVGAVNPRVAVISAGKGNSYGHPHQEVLATLERLNVQTVGTYEKGTIVFKSDGETLVRE